MLGNIAIIACFIMLIACVVETIRINKENKKAAADRKARTKYIKREYDGITVDITICPIPCALHEGDEYWNCEYKCEFFHGDFSFKDFPSIEQQMEAKILPLAQSVGRWKYRLKEIEEIS